jgi:hypothetical protein
MMLFFSNGALRASLDRKIPYFSRDFADERRRPASGL